MRYLYNTKIENISHAEEDRFIVTINSDTKNRDVALMDDLGRIFSDSFYDIEKRPYDEFYNAKLGYLKNVLIDKNGNVICKDYNQIAPFYDEISVVDFGSNRYYFITKQGDVLGREFKNVIGFANGIGVVVLGNDKYCLVDKNMNVISANYDYIHPFYNRDYSWAIIKGKKVIVDRNMNIISHSYVDDQGKVRDYENIITIDENSIVMHKREPKNDEGEKIKDYDKDKCYAYISVDGKQLGSSHKHIWYFSEGIGRVEDINGTTYVNLKGEYITDKYYKNSGNFNGG